MTKYIKMLARTLSATLVLALAVSGNIFAQLNPFQTMYYQNRYLLNPSLAGEQSGLNVNLMYRQQWSNFPGTPKTAALTADYQASDRVGLGLNVQDDQSGLIRATRVVGSYAYHLQLDDAGNRLNFGLSLGMNDSRIDRSKVNGDLSDEQINIYNQLKPYVDGDVGISYTSSHWLLSAVVPNLKSTLFKVSTTRYEADMLTFEATAAYKFNASDEDIGITMSPLVGFRSIKNFKNIIDLGMNVNMSNYGLYLQSIYHSNENISFGVGIDQKSYMLNFAYNLETGQIATYTRGAFEFGVKLRLFNKN